MFATPAKRKADELPGPSNKKQKDDAPAERTPYAKTQYYQVLWCVPFHSFVALLMREQASTSNEET